MRMFIGMILGCLLTGAALWVHDSVAASTSANGTPAISNQIVNWEVAARKWGDVKETAHTAWLKLQTIDDQPPAKGT